MKLLVSLWRGFCYLVGALVIAVAVYEFWFFAQILYWVDNNPQFTRFMEARFETLRQKTPKAQLQIQWTGYGAISVDLRSEEHTSELQSLRHLVCRLLLEKKKT